MYTVNNRKQSKYKDGMSLNTVYIYIYGFQPIIDFSIKSTFCDTIQACGKNKLLT